MLIRARRPFGATGTRLVNASATGQLRLDADGRPTEIRLLCADGRDILFPATDRRST